VTHRGLDAEGGPHEPALPTFPSRRFVDCSGGDPSVGLAVLHDGLAEYEVVERDAQGRGCELALTLLRATGYLSRVMPALRPNPAGPPIPVEGAQLGGRRVLDYAVLVHRGDWQAAAVPAAADAFLVPLCHAPVTGSAATEAPAGQALAVEGAEVAAVRREDDALTVRLFNPTAVPATTTIARDGRPARGQVVDLRGRELERFEATMTLDPGRIVTLRLDDT
jgi:alpha-mannosidase